MTFYSRYVIFFILKKGAIALSVKNQILQALEQNKGHVLSGQELANRFCVSRAAIWKAMKALKEEGYRIQATTNKGYCLEECSDMLSSVGTETYLSSKHSRCRIHSYDSIDSTNFHAKKIAVDGAAHGTVIMANEQTAGRGRMGRRFYSPADTGLYMSVILRPDGDIQNTMLITVAAAVAVCQSIEALTTRKPQIKWVNDIFLDGKKICGILTEAVSDFESGMVESVIVGIGLNVSTLPEQFPPELRSIAGSLFSNGITRNRLAAEIINRLLDMQENLSDSRLIEEYKKRSLLLGKEVSYCRNGQSHTGTAHDINAKGNLLVRHDSGDISVLRSGEVSITAV